MGLSTLDRPRRGSTFPRAFSYRGLLICCTAWVILVWLFPELLPPRLVDWLSTERGYMGPDVTRRFVDALREEYRVHTMTESFKRDGSVFEVNPDTALYHKSLGSDVLVLDVDNRFGDKFQVGKDEELNWDDMNDYQSAGALNHLLYATIHGYDYKVMKPEYDVKLNPTWYKVAGIAEGLKTHKFVIFMDGDGLFRYPELPVEWMLNYWNINDTVSLAGGLVPNNANNRGLRNWDIDLKYPKINTGFLIIQQTEKTDEMMQAWLDCPGGKRFPGCIRYRKDFPHEQGALADYIRLDPQFEDHIKSLPCPEADGQPENKFCKGKLIEHFWGFKDLVKGEVSKQGSPEMFEILYEVFRRRKMLMALEKVPEQWEQFLRE